MKTTIKESKIMTHVIRGCCRTNIDDFKRYEWPTEFVEVPQLGSWVRGKGSGSVGMPTLKVVNVTHCVDNDGPYVEIELHK